MHYLIQKLESEFFAWCQQLSVDEIASNDCLLKVIERIERMLQAAQSSTN